MRPLLVLSVRYAAIAVLCVLFVGAVGTTIRLLPWLVARDVPLALAVPFARVLVSTALEVSILVGVPVGVAIATAAFVDRGEARALLALGATPFRLVAALALPALAFVAGHVAVARAAEAPPSDLSHRLVGEGKKSCAEATSPRSVAVPLVSLTWLCFRAGARVVGRVPGLPDGAWFSASELVPSPDSGTVELSDLHIAARLGARAVTVHAGSSRFIGLPRWRTSHSFQGPVRALFVALSAALAGLSLSHSMIRRQVGSPLAAFGGSAAVALGLLGLVLRLDARNGAPVAYLIVPVAALVIPALLGKIPWNFPWIAREGPR